MRAKTKKVARALTEIRTSLYVSKDALKCPYCGKTMVHGTGATVESKFKDNEIMVCSGYPECDTYCRIKSDGANFKMISTPANKELRMLRKAVHHYMKVLTDNKVFADELTVHKVITNMSTLNKNCLIHIGEMREFACREAITNLIRVIYNNLGRINSFHDWCSNMPWLSGEAAAMREEINAKFVKASRKEIA